MRRRTRFHVLVPLALVLALAVVAAGCGGAAAPDGVRLSVAEAARKTSSVGTYKTELQITMSMPGVSGAIELTATGEVDTEAKRQAMSMDLSAILGALGGTGGATELKPDDLRIDMVMDGLTMYMRMPPPLMGAIAEGKQWLKMNVAALAKQQGTDLSSMLGQSYSDPSQFLDYLTSASGPVEELGREEVRGVDTRHVRAALDLEKYVAGLDADTREKIGPVVEQFRQLIGGEKPVLEAWVDDEGLVRRIAMDMSFAVPAGGGDSSVGMTMDLFDFRADVYVEIPPADQVFDATDLARTT